MKSTFVAIAALVFAQLAGTGICNARTAPHTPPQQDAPQALTKSQAQAAGMIKVVLHFEKIDANRDGLVTRAELRAYALANRRYVPMT
ncbi:MAG TPA: EF-hand domain-containing protein [Oxalicibacterium sp.]|nr:EF-hand domain-containing protein [Oxalicibacterium sp.]